MNRPLNLIVLLTAMLVVSPAIAQKKDEAIPSQAVGKDTMLAVYLDVTQSDAETLNSVGGRLVGVLGGVAQMLGEDIALPLGDPQQALAGLIGLRDSFIEAGGQGLMMTLEMPTDESWSPPMALLAKTKGELFDAASLEPLVQGMGDGEMASSVTPLNSGWQNIVLSSKDGEVVTQALPESDEQVHAALSRQLTQHKTPALAVAFRMNDEIREMMDSAEDMAKDAQPGQGQDQQAAMMMGIMMGMFKPVRSLDTLGLAISQVDDGMLVDAQMTFQDPQSAQMFSNLYNSVLMFAPMILSQAGQGQAENMPAPATISSFFTKLRMKVNGKNLTLSLDQAFFDLADQMAPLLEGMQGEILPSDLDI